MASIVQYCYFHSVWIHLHEWTIRSNISWSIHYWSNMGFYLYCIRYFWLGYYQASVEFVFQRILCWLSTVDNAYLSCYICRSCGWIFIYANLTTSNLSGCCALWQNIFKSIAHYTFQWKSCVWQRKT